MKILSIIREDKKSAKIQERWCDEGLTLRLRLFDWKKLLLFLYPNMLNIFICKFVALCHYQAIRLKSKLFSFKSSKQCHKFSTRKSRTMTTTIGQKMWINNYQVFLGYQLWNLMLWYHFWNLCAEVVLWTRVCVLPKFHMLNPYSQFGCFWRWDF